MTSRIDLPGQLELPQTEPRQAEFVRRMASDRLRPGSPQKPCDHGLFSDQPTQIDLEDLLRN